MAVFDELSDCECILVGVTASKTLVGHVEERVMLPLFHGLANLCPLLLGRVDTGRVMCTSVQQYHTASGCRFDVGEHTFKVEADCIFVVIAVFLNLKTGVLEHRVMVCPAGRGYVDFLRTRIEALEKCSANA